MGSFKYIIRIVYKLIINKHSTKQNYTSKILQNSTSTDKGLHEFQLTMCLLQRYSSTTKPQSGPSTLRPSPILPP